jgi:probable addiction module antidote protein
VVAQTQGHDRQDRDCLFIVARLAKETVMKDKPHDDAMAELYSDDPEFAVAMLNAILLDGDQAELMVMMRQMAKAFGGVQSVAEKAHLNATQIYRTLSPDGNPVLSSFTAILGAMNMQLAVQAVH